MSNSCNSTSCKMNHNEDGTIPQDLQDTWNIFIEKNCRSVDCDRRYTTKCCIWGDFEIDE